MFIAVIPAERTVILDGVPKLIDELEYPAGVRTLYFDYDSKQGARESADPTEPLQPVNSKALKPFLEAYQNAPGAEVAQEVASA